MWEYKKVITFNSPLSNRLDLNSFGKDGWELCAVAVIPRGGAPEEMIYYFKREVK